MTAIAIAGCAGRMGRALIREAIACPTLTLAGGFEAAGHASIGADLGALAGLEPLGVRVEGAAESALKGADVLIDFTTAAAAPANARAAAAAGAALVLGATGLSDAELAAVDALGRDIAVIRSGNFSLGVNLLAALAEEAARRLPDDYDIEIVEAHHRDKVDAPSGTALMLGGAAAAGRGVDLARRAVMSRTGQTQRRKAGEIGFASVRGGGIVGEHSVVFAATQEVVTLSHSAIDRALFAKGAIAAARFVAGKPPGLYSMRDVLGLSAR
ncbi:MAG: 4-hydroxy-tetrahydrodipicolinate reductase [Parvularculaceae bacterium]|nr:4-hydroxy-tetrahydrodipicolinate reductase [Parvularculaceae bacterium]